LDIFEATLGFFRLTIDGVKRYFFVYIAKGLEPPDIKYLKKLFRAKTFMYKDMYYFNMYNRTNNIMWQNMVQFSPLANMSIHMFGFNIFIEFPKVPKTLKFTDISVPWKKAIKNYGNISKKEIDEIRKRQEDAFNKSRERRND
jgi:hypothetical protein